MARSLTKKTMEIDSLKKDKDDLSAIRDSQKLRLNVSGVYLVVITVWEFCYQSSINWPLLTSNTYLRFN